MGSRIELRSVTADDFDRLIQWVESPSFLLRWAGPVFSYPLDTAQLSEHIAEAKKEEPIRRPYKAVTDDEEMVGYVELNDIDRRNASASVSRVIVSLDKRGRGYGTAMIRKLLEIGFRTFGLHRIDLRVFDFNDGAIECYEKAGFSREGVLRDARKHEDEYWTLVQMSVLEDEWRTITERGEAPDA